MRRVVGVLPAGVLLAGALMAGAASPEAERPLLRPTRDVDVVYQITPAANQPDRVLQQRLRWSASSQLMRVDLPSPRLYVIIDYRTRRMSTVRDVDRAVIDMPAPDQIVGPAAGSPTASYVRQGADTVVGMACAEWLTMASDGRQTETCITADGVMLRASAGGKTLLSAVSVQYAPQDASVFRVPADYVHHAVEGGQ
jgi:hypothetical protein